MPLIEIRPSANADAEFAFLVEEDAMRKYAEDTWGQWNPAQDRQGHIDSFDPKDNFVVEVNGQAAGILAVERHADHLFLGKLYLLAAYRSAGVGSQLLRMVIDEASFNGKQVHLNVLVVNHRALAFYLRHGFKIERRGSDRVYMIYEARDASPDS